MEKYLFLKKSNSNIIENNLYKIIAKKENSYLIAGKAPRNSNKAFTLYNLPFEKIDENWIELDKFLDNCILVGKKFYRTKELQAKNEAPNAFMKKSIYEPKVIMLAICSEGFIYYDQNSNNTYILNSTYIEDKNLKFLNSRADLPFELTKQAIKTAVVKSLNKKIEKNLFENIEF